MVPGAGEPNYDSFVASPYQTRRERREHEVHSLLDKLQPDTIVLDPQSVGNIKLDPKQVVAQKKEQQRAAAAAIVGVRAVVPRFRLLRWWRRRGDVVLA